MILLELAAQGIRGFSPAGGRATLRPGYNVVGAADGAVLRRLVEALLYPGPKDGDALPRALGGPANAPVRAGLTVVGNDRITYRLVRDFAAGAQLHRFDPEKRAFAPISQDLAEIAAFMQKTVGAPSPGKLRTLLALSAADLPSKQGGAGVLPSPTRASLTPDQARKRVGALRVELEKARVAETLQAKIDELQNRQFKLEEAFRGGASYQAEVDRAEAALAEHGPARELLSRLGDPDAKVALYEKATARKAEADERVAAERAAIAREEAAEPPVPFWKNRIFWACAGSALALLGFGIVGGFFRNEVRYVSLLDVGGFGWAGWLALRWIGGEEAKDRLARRKKVVDEWEKKVLAQYKRDTRDVIDAVNELRGAPIPGATRVGVTNTSELRDALHGAREALALVDEAKKRLDDWQNSTEIEKAATEKAQVDEALRSLEAKLSAAAGGFVRDVRSVESELQRLEAEAAAPQPVAAPPMPSAPARPTGDPLRSLVERAAIEVGGSPTAAVRAVSAKAAQTLAGLSFNRLGGLQVDDRGNLQVQSGGRPAPLANLSPADRDLVWIALKLAFLEQAVAGGKGFALCEDAFGGLSDGARRFAARLLKQIAKSGQIVHATTDPSFKEAADHAA